MRKYLAMPFGYTALALVWCAGHLVNAANWIEGDCNAPNT